MFNVLSYRLFTLLIRTEHRKQPRTQKYRLGKRYFSAFQFNAYRPAMISTKVSISF